MTSLAKVCNLFFSKITPCKDILTLSINRTQKLTNTLSYRKRFCYTILNSELFVNTTRSLDCEVIRKTILPNISLLHFEILSQILSDWLKIEHYIRVLAAVIADSLQLIVNCNCSNNRCRSSNASVEITYCSNFTLCVYQSNTNRNSLTYMLIRFICIVSHLKFTSLSIDSESVNSLVSTILNKCILIVETCTLQFISFLSCILINCINITAELSIRAN